MTIALFAKVLPPYAVRAVPIVSATGSCVGYCLAAGPVVRLAVPGWSGIAVRALGDSHLVCWS